MRAFLFLPLFLLIILQDGFAQEDAKYKKMEGEMIQHFIRGNYKQALDICKQNREYTQSINNDSLYSECLHNTAVLYDNLSCFQESELYFMKALNVRETKFGKESKYYASSLSGLALLYYNNDKLEESKTLSLKVKELKAVLYGKESIEYAQALHNLAAVYVTEEKFFKAEKVYLESAETFKAVKGEYSTDYAKIQHNLAVMYTNSKNFDKAVVAYEKAIAIRAKVYGEQHFYYANTLASLAGLYKQISKYDKSIALYAQAEKIMKATIGENHKFYIALINGIGQNYIDAKEFGKAEEYLHKAIVLNCLTPEQVDQQRIQEIAQLSFRSKTILMKTINNLLTLYRNQEQINKAVQLFELHKELYTQYKESFSSDKDKVRIFNSFKTQSTSAVRTYAELWSEDQETNYFDQAFSFAEQNKSILLQESVQSRFAANYGNLPEALSMEEDSLQKLKKELDKEELKIQHSEQRSQWLDKKNKLLLSITSFKKRLQQDYPKYYALKYDIKEISSADIQRDLKADEAFIEYFIAPKELYIFYITAKEKRIVEVKLTSKVLKDKVKQLRTCLTDYNQVLAQDPNFNKEYQATAHWFYQQLIAPINIDESIKNLSIVPDKHLGSIPFETLLEDGEEELNFATLSYLVRRFNIRYNYSAKLFTQEHLVEKKDLNGQLLAFGAEYKEEEDEQQDVHNLRSHLSPLPEALKEVAALEAQFQGLFLSKDKATEANFKKHMGKYSVVHLAMHGLLNPQSPILSSLAFSDIEGEEDNFLHAYEISQLSMNAELVMLSACETGYGKFKDGVGVQSLASSFMYAGAPSLVVSLWEVNDKTTADLVKAFYAELANDKYKSEALATAKNNYLAKAQGVSAHPAFWSPFIQIGADRPVHLETKTNGLLIGLGSLLLLALGFITLRRKK